MSDAIAVDVRILDKDYRVACKPQERDALINSARYLDRRMREIKESGKIVGSERVAVMAALNIAHELLNQRDTREHNVDAMCAQVKTLQDKLEHALHLIPQSRDGASAQ